MSDNYDDFGPLVENEADYDTTAEQRHWVVTVNKRDGTATTEGPWDTATAEDIRKHWNDPGTVMFLVPEMEG